MADPIIAMELEEINDERQAAGLTPLTDISEARKWKADPKVEQKEQPKPEEVKPSEVKNDEPIKTEDAPQQVVIPVAAKKTAAEPNARIAELERQLQSMKTEEGRVAKLDRLLKESEARIAEAERKVQEAEQRAADIERKAKGTGIRSYLTPEQLEGADEGLLDAFDRMNADTRRELEQGTKAEVGSIRERQQEREAAEREREASMLQSRVDDLWLNKITPVIPKEVWSKFAGHPKWEEWCNRSYAGSTRGEVFDASINSLDHEAAIEQIRNFMGFADIEIPAKGSKPPLRATEAKGQQAIDDDPNKPKMYNADEVKPIYDGFFRGSKLPSGWTQKQFMAWADEIDKALSQGRVVDRTGKAVGTI